MLESVMGHLFKIVGMGNKVTFVSFVGSQYKQSFNVKLKYIIKRQDAR